MLRKSLHFRWCSRTCPRTPRNTLPPAYPSTPSRVRGKGWQGKGTHCWHSLAYMNYSASTETDVAFTREYTWDIEPKER
jgi:hypothetical protein